MFNKSPKLVGKIKSVIDKIDDVDVKPDGTVVHKWLRVTLKKDPKKGENKENAKKLKKAGIKIASNGNHLGKYRTWPNIASFKRWRTIHLKDRREFLRNRLSPLEYYVTQGMGHERPFTGEMWSKKEVGVYSCKVCD